MAEELAKAQRLRLDNAAKGIKTDLDSLKDMYLETIKRNTSSPKHYSNVKCRLGKYLSAAKIVDISQITTTSVQQFCNILKVKDRTVRGYKITISGFCTFLVNHSHLPSNPCQQVRLPKILDPPPRFLTNKEYDQVLSVAAKMGKLAYLGVFIILKAGLRSDEARRLRWDDVMFPDNLLVIRKERGKRGRAVPLHPELAALLKQYAQPSGYVFPGHRGGAIGGKQWRALFQPLKQVKAFKRMGNLLHGLRSTFASRYVQAGGDIYQLSAYLGHRSVDTTRRSYAYLQQRHSDDILGRI